MVSVVGASACKHRSMLLLRHGGEPTESPVGRPRAPLNRDLFVIATSKGHEFLSITRPIFELKVEDARRIFVGGATDQNGRPVMPAGEMVTKMTLRVARDLRAELETH